MPPPIETIVAAFPYEGGYVLISSGGAVYCFNCTYHGGLQWDGMTWKAIGQS